MKGLLLIAVLASAILMPVAGAASLPLQTFLTLGIRAEIDLLEEFNPTRPQGDDLVASCGSGHLTPLADNSGFRFSEDSTQKGCAEGRLRFRLPEGSPGAQVRFRADRSVRQPANPGGTNLPVDMPQLFRLYLGNDTSTIVQEQILFSLTVLESNGRQDFLYPLNVPSGTRDVTLGWYFEDRGPGLGSQVSNPITGQGLTAVVSDIVVETVGLPADVEHSERKQIGAHQDRATERTRIEVRVPADLMARYQVGLQFRGTPALSLAEIIGPDGAVLGPQETEVRLENGLYEVALPAAAIDSHGPGRYTATFEESVTLEANDWLLLLVPFLMVSPIPAGALAWRETRKLHIAGDVVRSAAAQLRFTIAVVVTVYVGVMAWFAAGPQWPLVVAWPLPLEAAFFHVALAMCTAALVGIGYRGRRRLVHAMQSDLDEKHRFNEELRRSNEELERFAYVASHDLQEPLRMVSSYTQLLQRRYGGRLDPDADEFIGYAADGANRMQRLLDGLLAYSRVTTKGRPFHAVSMENVLRDARRNLEMAVSESGARITHDKMPAVAGDEVQLVQLLQNLLQNAIKFRGAQPPKIHVGCKDEGENWHLFVRDNGIGIDPKHHERVFLIFQRLHPPEKYEGTGLGLALCKKIIERHGGRIWVESKPGDGATFHFTLPKQTTPRDNP